MTNIEPKEDKPGIEEEECDGSGSLSVGALDEVEAKARDDTSQGDSEVLAEGNHIRKWNPASKTSESENGPAGGREGGSRGEQGCGLEKQGGKQQWDPGSG